ncbi:ferredoxin [Gordonia sp. ABSL11-1]|uniref:ferredoxin n=1 Tax=Gordonia sp. ABSL11-1 TaxID=3053924 RepID=UPI002573FD02|nr:ferredoxin [Gordonia sp. ABSL11-1]MDL9948936.1 ferredoxin [Gordonia sp. ABSL11-1]
MSEQKWRAEVSRGCIGAGFCVAVAPDHFVFAGGRAQSTHQSVTAGDGVGLLRTAADVCPAAAISISSD